LHVVLITGLMFMMSAAMIWIGGSLAARLQSHVPAKCIGTLSGLLLLALGIHKP